MRPHHCYAVVASIAFSGSAVGQSTPRTPPSSIRSVSLGATSQPGTAIVVVESNGPLPEPESGAALNPPRIYLDFTDVLPIRTVQPEADPIVSRIRVAEHAASPLVTRVVVDLHTSLPYRIDASGRAQGRVLLIIGPADTPTRSSASPPPAARAGSPSATASPTAAAPAQPSAAPRATRRRAEPTGTQYDTRVAAALVRIHALKPLLEAIDRRVEMLSGDLPGAAKEFDDIAKLLSELKPPPSRATAHALLLRTCTLGARAVRLRQQPVAAGQDANVTWDAASAAAGALLMLERANGELVGK